MLYRRDYNCYGEQKGDYYVYNDGDDAYTIAKRSVYFSVADDYVVTLGIDDQTYFKQDVGGKLKTQSDAISSFCAESDIDPNKIVETGFAYLYRDSPIYIPCYLILVEGDNEFIKNSNMDLSIYQEYSLFAIPAIVLT